MIFVIDIDDTIGGLQEAVIDIFNARYNTKYTIEDFIEYDTERCLPKQDAINFKAIYHEPGIYDRVKPIPGAQNSIKKLIRDGHEVYIVTNSKPSIFEEKVNWVKYFFPFVNDDHIVCMTNKWMINCDIMIEDRIDTLLAKPFYTRICMDRPWNRKVHDEVYGIARCSNWGEIMEVVNKICNEG